MPVKKRSGLLLPEWAQRAALWGVLALISLLGYFVRRSYEGLSTDVDALKQQMSKIEGKIDGLLRR